MIYRIFPTKDTFITNYKRLGTPRTGSNFGASEIANMFVVGYTSGTSGISSGSAARILTHFDITEFQELMDSGRAPANGGISYYLRMKNAPHATTLPFSYDVEVLPMARDWDEGRGVDNDFFTDLGYANWDRAKSNVFWTRPGGDFIASPYATYHFDQGDEDLLVDVTEIVQGWMSGNFINNGFMVKMSSSLESGSLDYFVKMFHTRHTHFGDRMPYLEARWNDAFTDDRSNFVFDTTGSLYLYHRSRGVISNIRGVGTGSLSVRIADASGTLLNLTGSYAGQTGIYSVSFALPTGSYSGSVFHDIWYSGSNSYYTGTFYPDSEGFWDSIGSVPFYTSLVDLHNEYEGDEVVRFGLFVRPRDYNPATVLTSSAEPPGTVVTKAYYRIDNDRTREVVVPFGTGSVPVTQLSYDGRGNYFNFFMKSLPPGNIYRLVFLFDIDGQKQLIDRDFKFRVV